jgi:low density lipoprotein receptor-related protein 5/6
MYSYLHVIRANGTQPKTIQTKEPLTPMDLVVFEEQKIPTPKWASLYGKDVTNPCDKAACSHLCLLCPDPPYYACACPIGIKLINGSTTQCSKEITNFLLVARGSSDIRRISLDTDDFTDVILPLTGIKHVLAVDYHVESGFIFWTDDEATRIRKGWCVLFLKWINCLCSCEFKPVL